MFHFISFFSLKLNATKLASVNKRFILWKRLEKHIIFFRSSSISTATLVDPGSNFLSTQKSPTTVQMGDPSWDHDIDEFKLPYLDMETGLCFYLKFISKLISKYY